MKIYLVGGAIRDSLLNLPVLEKDWVVVNATEAELIENGYKKIGKDFPVFLHPETKEEYALARKEKKIGDGHKGFKFISDPDITLEEDLLRRDLTINAIAQDKEGKLIDPYKGQFDLKNRTLRHVSEAFSEDPLRVFRVARFQAKLKYLGFEISLDTLKLMQEISSSGEIQTLSKERFWMEIQKALLTKNPEVFFDVLKQVGALERITTLKILNEPEIMTASKESKDISILWAIVVAKNIDIKSINESFNVPNEVSEISIICDSLINLQERELTAELLLEIVQNSDLMRKPERFFKAANAASYFRKEESKNIVWESIFELLKDIKVEKKLKEGKSIAKKLYEDRLHVLNNYLLNL